MLKTDLILRSPVQYLGGQSEDVLAAGQFGGVLARAGLHCSPNGHRAIGTFPVGTVRVSPGPFTTRAEIATFLSALRKLRDLSA